MASGFSNSQDQLTPTYYRVYIDTSGYDTNATRTTSGAVEPFDYDSFATLNTSLNNSLRRARGNIRWNAILQELQRFSNCEILDVTATKSGPAFEDAADGSVIIRDASDHTQVAIAEPGTNGFLRGTLRGLMRTRLFHFTLLPFGLLTRLRLGPEPGFLFFACLAFRRDPGLFLRLRTRLCLFPR